MNKKIYIYSPLKEPIPITEQEWPEGTLPLVTTRTATYMHEPYIRDCIEGILIQKTTFPVEVVIHDDASTDNTAGIVREYEANNPNLIKAIYQKENQYSKPAMGTFRQDLQNASRGKYIALCEGDDYWTDPNKLQKQVDFLESNPEYILCVHNANVIFQDKNKRSRPFNKALGMNSFDLNDLIKRYWFIPTASMVFRAEYLKIPIWLKYIQQGDFALALLLAREGKIYYFEEMMSVYRKNCSSLGAISSITKTEFKKLELLSYFDLHTNFKYHQDICNRKESIQNSIYYKFLKETGRFRKYLNWDYWMYKFKFVRK